MARFAGTFFWNVFSLAGNWLVSRECGVGNQRIAQAHFAHELSMEVANPKGGDADKLSFKKGVGNLYQVFMLGSPKAQASPMSSWPFGLAQ
ncbi:MAG: hypothetical protein H6555_10825 [Lewinellaceae bacterium]|nr:hypothetical protein [Lewinellaceae bacterium]